MKNTFTAFSTIYHFATGVRFGVIKPFDSGFILLHNQLTRFYDDIEDK